MSQNHVTAKGTCTYCGSILKQSFIEQGFDRATSNEFAIDALKITMQTLKDLV